MDKALIDGLIELIGKEAVVADATRLLTYESDALAMYHEKADLVILPADTAQTAACMKLIASFGVPIVPRGAGTGLTGGARPIKGGVVVATSRMRQVFEVNPTDGYARTGAGLVNVDLTHACEDHGLFYAPDPSSQRACTIGGNVANNSGGPHGFKYGSTTQHILGLVIVLADGEVLDLSEPRVDPDGLDLIGLFVGSEGTFGIATEVTVKLVPTPEIVETLLAVYTGDEGLSEACDTVSEIIRVGLEPSAIEILDTLTIAAVEDSVFAAGYPRDASAVLLMEVEGTPTEVQGTSSDIMKLAKAFGAVELRRAKTEAERAMLWAGRKGAFGAMGRIAPDLYVADAVVPRTKLREMVRTTVAIAEKYKLKLATVFHAGDGNLHPNICYDRRDLEETQRVVTAGAEILEACVAAGGSLTGEHGIGLEKLAEIGLLFTEQDLQAMGRIRRAWDPDLRMNPGKALPLRACVELGDKPMSTVEA
ncbi:MAG: glycolate oxidase subunit GlcD [Bacteroidia bacterium]|jgi:glycolate oxidase subunit GlcD